MRRWRSVTVERFPGGAERVNVEGGRRSGDLVLTVIDSQCIPSKQLDLCAGLVPGGEPEFTDLLVVADKFDPSDPK